MSTPRDRTKLRPRRLHLDAQRPKEHRRPGEPSDYPRGYIEQLARTFSSARTGAGATARRRRP